MTRHVNHERKNISTYHLSA